MQDFTLTFPQPDLSTTKLDLAILWLSKNHSLFTCVVGHNDSDDNSMKANLLLCC